MNRKTPAESGGRPSKGNYFEERAEKGSSLFNFKVSMIDLEMEFFFNGKSVTNLKLLRIQHFKCLVGGITGIIHELVS